MRKVHDFLTVGAAAPQQQVGIAAVDLPDEYYRELAVSYDAPRFRAQHAPHGGLPPVYAKGRLLC